MNLIPLIIDAHPVSIFLPEEATDGLILLPMEPDRAAGICALLKASRTALIAVGGFDWNRDLSPWPAPAVFPGEADFSGQADAFLQKLLHTILPEAEHAAHIAPTWRGVAGYSLAGLFAAYAAFRCEAFTRIASVSGSMWYDGWLSFARNTPFSAPVDRAYFSVGAKEKRTRNPRMAPVEANTQMMRELFADRGAESLFELNPGNHFVDTELRMVKAITFLTK